jgi:hypothetical protein
MAGYIRGWPPRRMIREAIDNLRQGSVLLLFPEGTRTTAAPTGPLTASVAVIAKHARVPVQTAIIETDSPYLSKGWSLFRAPTLPIRYRVRLGKRFEAPDDVGALMEELEREYRTQLAAAPQAMVLGEPVFDASAPSIRVKGRKVSNWWTNLETLWAGIHDSLFGFRVYPIAPLLSVMQRSLWMRRFDFDVEAVVRLSWRGVPAVNLRAPVRYFTRAEGGVSHFNYWRDNVLLTSMHTRLFFGFILRLPLLLGRRLLRR